MNRVRLWLQKLWSDVAIPLGFHDRLSQFCDHCGRPGGSYGWIRWWSDIEVWEAVAGNLNGCHHGCFCAPCFSEMAAEKGITLVWKPYFENNIQN